MKTKWNMGLIENMQKQISRIDTHIAFYKSEKARGQVRKWEKEKSRIQSELDKLLK